MHLLRILELYLMITPISIRATCVREMQLPGIEGSQGPMHTRAALVAGISDWLPSPAP